MVRQNVLEVVQNRPRKHLKALPISYIALMLVSNITIAQEVPVPESIKTFPNAKCYWSYSVERLSTTHDSIHNYIIRVQLEQQDSSGNNKGRLRLKHAIVYCDFSDKGISKKVKCKQKGLQWVAKFKVSTNQPLPVRIIANYNEHQRAMPLTLNKGTYPGEPDG